MENSQQIPGKDIGLIAYLTIIGLIVAMVKNGEQHTEFGKYHIRQSLGIFLTGFSLFFVGFVPFVGWVLSLVGVFLVLYMLVMGIINAINGRMQPVPVLGDRYNDWLKGL